MALSDPLSIDIGAGSVSLPRVSTGLNNSSYTSSDGGITLLASHAYGKRTRRVIRLDLAKVSADPLIPANNQRVTSSVYTVFDIPATGYSASDMRSAYNGLTALLAASTDAALIKFLGGEN